MGEFIEIGVNGASMQVVSGVFCAAALGLFALMQPDPSDDDDSNGGGGGGLMQPISWFCIELNKFVELDFQYQFKFLFSLILIS